MGSCCRRDATDSPLVCPGRCDRLREDISGLPRGEGGGGMLASPQVLPPCQDLEGETPKARWGTVGFGDFREFQMRVQGTSNPLQVIWEMWLKKHPMIWPLHKEIMAPD